MMSIDGEARRGALDMLPMLVGYAPFAVVVGTTIAAQHEPLAAWAGTWAIYGGAAHLAVLSGISAGSGWAVAILAGLLVNARLLVYSASIAAPWREQPRRSKVLAAALLTDAVWAAATSRNAKPGTDAQRRRYYLGAACTLWTGWLIMVSAAALSGSRLPAGDHLALAPALCLLALIGPTLRTSAGRAAAGGAALVAMIPDRWAGGAGLLVAVAVGTAAGLFGDRDPVLNRRRKVVR